MTEYAEKSLIFSGNASLPYLKKENEAKKWKTILNPELHWVSILKNRFYTD